MGRFELKRTKTTKRFYFSLAAVNGQLVLQSGLYVEKRSAENAIQSVRRNAVRPEQFVRGQAENGHYYFELKSGSGSVIAISQQYYSEEARDNGLAVVKLNAPEAELVDLT